MHSSIQNSPLYLWYFKETEISANILGRYSNIKFTEYSPYGSKEVPFGRTDMKKLIVAFHIFEHA